MSVISALRRYRFSVLVFSFCLIAMLFTNQGISTPLLAAEKPANTQPAEPTNGKTPLSVTENVRKTVLPNGLTVLTKEVHTAPVVTAQVWYKVGSRNEAPGVNGIAHQLEHMLFKGTKNRPIQFGRLFSALGSDSNAFTSYDQTAYFGTVERQKLIALLTLEADRMQNSLITPEQLESEKRVVISELQGYENSPNYRLNRAVMRTVFPKHPYGLPVGGTKADVQKFTVEQVRQYYRQFYSPDNATLVIVGDFQTEPTLKAVQETFGKIPTENKQDALTRGRSDAGNTSATAPTTLRSQDSGLRTQDSKLRTPIVLRESGSVAFLQAVYPLPGVNNPDVPAIDLMDYILTGGRNSRLYQALVESGLASDVGAYAANMLAGGWYDVSVTAAPGQDLPKIDSVLQDAIAKLLKQGVTPEEVNRAKAQLQASVILNNRDISNQAMQLAHDELIAGDYRYTDRYLAAMMQVTPQDVQRVANQYLKSEARTVGFFEPTQQQGDASGGAAGGMKTAENFTSGPPVDPAEVAKYLPPIDAVNTLPSRALPEQISLPNGLVVLLLPDNSTPTVALSGFIRGGRELDPANKEGLASLTAENLLNGTTNKDALSIAKALEERGASLNFTAFREGVDISGASLATDLPVLVNTLADVIQNPTFPSDRLELSRKQALTALKEELDDPSKVAQRIFQQKVYPENHPFHRFATKESLQRISREDVIAFKGANYRPETMVLSLVGDFNKAAVKSLLQKELGNWRASGKSPALKYPVVSLPQNVMRVNQVLPGKAQSVTFMGYKGIDRQDPRYYAALVLNQIIGGDTLSSRLGTEVRDRQGLTYGIYSTFQAGKSPGPFLIWMQTDPQDANRAIASARKLLAEVQKSGVTSAEVETAKRSLASNYTVSLANPDELTNTILFNQVYGLDTKELRAFPDKIQAVTLSQVNQAAKELLHPDNLVVVTAGPPVVAKQGKM
jgi:zinc protease